MAQTIFFVSATVYILVTLIVSYLGLTPNTNRIIAIVGIVGLIIWILVYLINGRAPVVN